MNNNTIVSDEQWLAARHALLAREKDLMQQEDALAEARRALPWRRVPEYVFDAPEGKRTLADLFAGRRQLLVQHFMLGPGWEQGCPSCSYMADHVDGMRVHLEHRDIAFVAVSRATLPEIQRFRSRMGWQFPWVSSHGNAFNRDFAVSFTPQELATGEVYYNYARRPFPAEEAPGVSVFCKDDAGQVFHTYSTFGRGVEVMMGAYRMMDLVPRGRDEQGLAYTMEWVRHHDRYESSARAATACCHRTA